MGTTERRKERMRAEQEKLRTNVGWVLLCTDDGTTSKMKGKSTWGRKEGAGVTWKNRRILAERKAANAREGSVGVGAYDVSYGAVEKGVKVAAHFEREKKARDREVERVGRKEGLKIRKAVDIVADESRGEFLSTQLPKKWVKEGEEEAEEDGTAVAEMTKPVFSYKEPTPLPRQAQEKRKLERMAESRRDSYLSTQIQKEWGGEKVKEKERQSMYKEVGRDEFAAVLGEDDEMKLVRVGFTEDKGKIKGDGTGALGPGVYDPFRDDWKKDVDDVGVGMSEVRTGRGNAIGPFGERLMEAEEEEIKEKGREGDRLLLDVEKAEDALRGSVQNVIFGTAGVDDDGADLDVNELGRGREGDILELELDERVGRRGREREGKGIVAWDKLTGRDEDVGGGGVMAKVGRETT